MPFTSSPVDSLSRVFLFAVLLLAPWLHGAEQIWEQLFTSAGIFIGLLLILTANSITLSIETQAKQVLTFFTLWLVYCLLYLIPLPNALIEFVSPATFNWYNHVDRASSNYLSIYRQASLIEMLKYGALVALFVLVITLFKRPEKLRQLAYVIVISAVATAFYSQLNYLSEGRFELVSAIPPWDFSWKEGIRGTFSYKNQYALYLVMCLCVTAGVTADAVISLRRQYNRWFSAQVVWLGVAFILLLLTLLNTSSRGALLSLALAAVLTLSLLILRNRFLATRILNRKVLTISIIGFLILAAGFTQSSIYDRFTSQKMEDNGRAMLRETASQVFADYPVVGTGPGTYPYIQHQYKPLLLGNSQMSKRAHNDYLETLATQGIVGFTLLALPLSMMLLTLLRTSLSTNSAGLLVGSQTAVIAYLLQAAFDVNAGVFLLPLLFILVLSIGWTISRQSLTQQAYYSGA